MFHSCLVCTDLSDGLYRLAEFLPHLAAGGLKKIVLLHSVPLWEEGKIPRIDEEAIEKARASLQQRLKTIPDGVEVKIEVPSGVPIETIPKVAQANKIDVIITGMPIRSLLQEKLFGSTTAGLAKACERPLLILRPQLISTYTCEELELRCQHLFRYLLIPYNGSNASKYLVQKVKQYAQQRPDDSLKECLLMWVVEEGGRREIPKDYQLKEAQEKLAGVKAELEPLGLQVTTQVRLGDPYMEILDAALEFDISAIAIASDNFGKLIEFPVRSFAGELMRRSWHPVLFFPPQR
ncbi:MAG: universal stress protein [Coleofasciculus sp. C3-bin4]|nr:universal stress protein [Coleofasciculus sp. Co-bin14]MBD0363274.1 universal stress protein [Coleofasciculus sp. C3-bin4]